VTAPLPFYAHGNVALLGDAVRHILTDLSACVIEYANDPGACNDDAFWRRCWTSDRGETLCSTLIRNADPKR
jgi:hypothetical protein